LIAARDARFAARRAVKLLGVNAYMSLPNRSNQPEIVFVLKQQSLKKESILDLV
jgi:hypothetical protein